MSSSCCEEARGERRTGVISHSHQSRGGGIPSKCPGVVHPTRYSVPATEGTPVFCRMIYARSEPPGLYFFVVLPRGIVSKIVLMTA